MNESWKCYKIKQLNKLTYDMQRPSKALILDLQCIESVLNTLHWNHTPEIFFKVQISGLQPQTSWFKFPGVKPGYVNF